MAMPNDLGMGSQIACARQRDLTREANRERLAGQIQRETAGVGVLLLQRISGALAAAKGRARGQRERVEVGVGNIPRTLAPN